MPTRSTISARTSRGDVPVVRVFLPDAEEVDGRSTSRATKASSSRIHDAGLFAGRLSNGIAALSRCARASATARSSSRIPTAFRRCCPISISICWARARIMQLYEKLGAHPMTLDGVAASPSRCSRPMPGASAWSATSTSGTAAATPCACAATASGKSSSRRQGRRQLQIRDHRRRRPAAAAEVRSGRLRRRGAAARPPRSSSTSTPSPRPRAARRAASTRSSAPISIYEVHLGSWRRQPEEGDRWLTYRELAERAAGLRRATWASPMSNSCRSPSIRSTARGAISRPACSRRPAASARRRISPRWSTPAIAPASPCSSTGCRAISPTIRTGSASSTAPRSTSTPIRSRAGISTGTR